MKLKEKSRTPADRNTPSHSRGYRVGYQRPPKDHQFKPGRSGNLKGRPNGSKNVATLVLEVLRRKIKVHDRGQIRHVPTLEAMVLKFIESALKGNTKSATFLFNWYAEVEAAEKNLKKKVTTITDKMTLKEAMGAYIASLEEDDH
jgi:hypothetical protein